MLKKDIDVGRILSRSEDGYRVVIEDWFLTRISVGIENIYVVLEQEKMAPSFAWMD